MSDFPEPSRRDTIIGRAEIEAQLRAALAQGALANGWLITGGAGAGKATLAYRLARAILDPKALVDSASLQTPAAARVFRLVAQRAHPDLFIVQREYDEKNQRHQTEIPVDKIRELSGFLSMTAAQGGWRVAIVDTADELNRQAANALLKSLEEPPAKTAMLLLSCAPGRLLATIRSRCRRIDLKPVADSQIAALLASELGLDADAAMTVAAAAGGRPGYALTLGAGEGADTVESVGAFLASALARGEPGEAAGVVAGKTGAAKWEIFTGVLLEKVSAAARAAASGEGAPAPLSGLSPEALLSAYEAVRTLILRGDAVNLDKALLLGGMARRLRAAALHRAA